MFVLILETREADGLGEVGEAIVVVAGGLETAREADVVAGASPGGIAGWLHFARSIPSGARVLDRNRDRALFSPASSNRP